MTSPCCQAPAGCRHRPLAPLPDGDYSRLTLDRAYAERHGRRPTWMGREHRVVGIPFWTAPPGYCRWCGAPLNIYLKDGRRDTRVRWHGPCAAAYNAQQPTAQRRRILARDGRVCQACGVKCGHGNFGDTAPPPAIDHVVPLIDGGANEDANLQTLCVPCHKVKTAAEAGRRAEARRSAVG